MLQASEKTPFQPPYLSANRGLAIEVDGSLLVADRGNGRVLRFKPGATGQGSHEVGPYQPMS